MYYIQETDKPNFLLSMFNIVKLQKDKIILPILEDEKITYKKAQNLAKKINKVLSKTNCKTVLVSNKLKQQEEILNFLYTYNYNIVKGKMLFEILFERVLDYLVEKKNLDLQNMQISILVNDLSDFRLEIVKKITRKYRKVNIVTNHIEKFKNIEKAMMDDKGISLIVNNNKKKSLAKSHIILNFDFPTELINKYNVFDEAIIVNFNDKIKINKKRFNGINICDYEIDFDDNMDEFDFDKFGSFSKKDIYESKLLKKQPFKDIIKMLNKDKVKIVQLKTSNMII